MNTSGSGQESQQDRGNDQDERSLSLALLLSHRRDLIVEMMRRKEIRIRRSISVPDLRLKLEELLAAQELSPSDLVQILNQLEGWGRQQIYLYQFAGGQSVKQQWLNPSWVENHFRQIGQQELLNNTRPIVLPEEPQLVSVEYDNSLHTVRFIWAQKRTMLERAEEEDPPPDRFRAVGESELERIIYHAYRELTVRGIVSFEWDIDADEAMLMIRKLTGTDYALVRNGRLSELGEFLPIQDFRAVPIAAVVTRLDRSDEVVRRQLSFRSLNNEGTLTVASGNQEDVFADKVLEQARLQIIENVTGLSGNIRWKTEKNKTILIELYGKIADDQRIGIPAQGLEEDIRHVLRRIRTYCA